MLFYSDYISATDEDVRRFELCQQNGSANEQVGTLILYLLINTNYVY